MRKVFAFAALALVSVSAAAAGNVADGQKIAEKVCAACHGAGGDTPISPDFPKLAGQHYDYLLHTLKGYKSGARKNAVMAGQAQALTTKDMEDVAAFFASRPGSLHVIQQKIVH